MTPILPIGELGQNTREIFSVYFKVQNLNGFVLDLYSLCVGRDTEPRTELLAGQKAYIWITYRVPRDKRKTINFRKETV